MELDKSLNKEYFGSIPKKKRVLQKDFNSSVHEVLKINTKF